MEHRSLVMISSYAFFCTASILFIVDEKYVGVLSRATCQVYSNIARVFQRTSTPLCRPIFKSIPDIEKWKFLGGSRTRKSHLSVSTLMCERFTYLYITFNGVIWKISGGTL